MTTNINRALVVLGTAAALAAPATAVAKKGGNGKHGGSVVALEDGVQAAPGKGKAKGKSKPKTYVFKGVVASVDAGVVTVSVKKGNKRGRRAAAQDVAFDVSAAKVEVADTNADGAADAADVKVGDVVVVQARLASGVDLAAGPHVARKLVDLTAPPADEDEGTDAGEVTPPPAG